MNNFRNTRDVVLGFKKHIGGETLDFGAGIAKYKSIIIPNTSSYTSFDMVGGKNVDVVGDVLSPPFKDDSFDSIICTQVLEHVEKPWVVIHEMGRILRPGGICIVTAPFMLPYHADPNDFFRYTKEGLESLFINENFEIIKSGSYGKFFSVLSEIIHFIFLNPYKNKNSTERKKKWINRIMRRIEGFSFFLDGLIKNKIVYANVYVLVRKK